jgi:hypothetical protein
VKTCPAHVSKLRSAELRHAALMDLMGKATLQQPDHHGYQNAFRARARPLKPHDKGAWLGQQISPVTPDSGFCISSTAPTAKTSLSMFHDDYVSWRDVTCWTRGDRFVAKRLYLECYGSCSWSQTVPVTEVDFSLEGFLTDFLICSLIYEGSADVPCCTNADGIRSSLQRTLLTAPARCTGS